jgi:hypothetical protein
MFISLLAPLITPQLPPFQGGRGLGASKGTKNKNKKIEKTLKMV